MIVRLSLPEQSTSSERLEAVNVPVELAQSGQSGAVSLHLELSLQAAGQFLHSQVGLPRQTRQGQQKYQGCNR